ncbi:MAG: glycosyltransferase family 4 protein [Bacteriovoracaceae bacterium]|nr:glycosyltransferase family 4 protein [Bacteriovoracaceae bacterium]
MSKRILIFSHEFPPIGGGAGIVGYQYALNFSQLGYSVDVLTSVPFKKKNEDFQIYRNSWRGKLWPIGYLFKVDFTKYDYIFLNDASAVFIAGLTFNKSTLAKSIVFFHGSEISRIYEKTNVFRRIIFFKFFFNRALKNSKQVVLPSNYMKKELFIHLEGDLFRDKMIVNYYGVNAHLFYNDSKDNNLLRKQNKIMKDDIVLLSVSRIDRKKGYLDKLNIFEKLITQSEEKFQWIIVGNGDFLSELKEKADSLKLSKYITFLDYINREDLRKYYSMADLFWLLSDYNEAFGLCYVESQLCGTPVIGRNKAGVKEAILNNETGFLVNDNEEVLDILLNGRYKTVSESLISKVPKEFLLEASTLKLKKEILSR